MDNIKRTPYMLELRTEGVLVDVIEGVDNEAILEHLRKEKCTEIPGWRSNMHSSFNTNRHIFARATALEVLEVSLLERVSMFLADAGVDLENNHVIMTSSFFNEGAPGSFQEFHTHSFEDVSSVYYVSASADSGDLTLSTFRAPLCAQVRALDRDYDLHIPPETGGVRVFPSSLPHQVDLNRTDKPRVSIACNYRVVPKE